MKQSIVNPQTQRSIAVFTGSRAEYGLLRHLITAIADEPGLRLQLIVSGSHLSTCYGGTIDEIINLDGHRPAALVPLSLDSRPQPSMAILSAQALAGVAEALVSLQPELLILLGDRYEAFAAAAASHLLGVPVAHLHGGETTKGAIDDRLRNAITQLSTWHFTAAEPYRQRVIAMGHPPERVFNVGPMALDGFHAAKPISLNSFEQKIGYRFGSRNLLITYHPETLLPDRGVPGFKALLEVLECTSCNVLFTHPNVDDGSHQLLDLLHKFVDDHPRRSWHVSSLGQDYYFAALQLFDAMAGNSSSGVIEAPLFGMPVLNIGDRQAGRLRHKLIHDVPAEPGAIAHGLELVLDVGRCFVAPKQQQLQGSAPGATILNWLRDGKFTG